ncbi:GDSL-type esterase/lipase family protein [Botrimarina hoheduenensis]|nr:GDSL-type esterase/lipase family protein [Botrimarina hoheduenensis]
MGSLSLLLSSPTERVADAQSVATMPVAMQAQPRPDKWWQDRHQSRLEQKQAFAEQDQAVRLVFIGDSITHGWENAGKQLWQERFAPYTTLNLGFSGDRTEHVLWRLGLGDAGEENNEVAGLSPALYVIMIGTNNTGHGMGTAAETAEGVTAIVDRLQELSPKSDILLLAVFPRGETPDDEKRLMNDEVNERIAKLEAREHVEYLNLRDIFLDDNGVLPKSVMPDLLHPNAEGYRRWADAITPIIKRYLSE